MSETFEVKKVRRNNRNKAAVLFMPAEICDKLGMTFDTEYKVKVTIEIVRGDIDGTQSFQA